MPRQKSKSKKQPGSDRIRINISNEIDHKTLWEMGFSRTRLIAGVISSVVIFIALLYSLIAFTPLRTTIPGYPDPYTIRAAANNAYVIDSLELVIDRWELYTQNLRNVLDGKDPVSLDNLLKMSDDPEAIAKAKRDFERADSVLRTKVRSGESISISVDPSLFE